MVSREFRPLLLGRPNRAVCFIATPVQVWDDSVADSNERFGEAIRRRESHRIADASPGAPASRIPGYRMGRAASWIPLVFIDNEPLCNLLLHDYPFCALMLLDSAVPSMIISFSSRLPLSATC